MLTLTRSHARSHRARTRRQTYFEALESRALLSSTLFQQVNLVSDGGVPALHTDPNLVNAWGIAHGPNTPFWISDNGAGLTSTYDGTGNILSKVVTIPGAGGMDAAPTGQLFNPTSDFMLTSGTASGSSLFIFAGEDGGISGWSPKVDSTHAILMVDHAFDGAVFKGITMATTSAGNNVLLAADFHNGTIDEFDASFHQLTLPTGAFTDSNIPAGFAPFNVQNIGGKIYITYAKQDSDAHDDVAGNGNGYVDVYSADGTLLQRFQHGGFLNSPWALVQAPQDASWGRFSGDILVGNFGSGHIDAFDPATGRFEGRLRASDHKPLTIDGLWGLSFGSGGLTGPTNTLFFTAGPNHEANGLFGSLTPTKKPDHGHDHVEGHLMFKL